MSLVSILSIPAWMAILVFLDVVERRRPWISVAGYAALSAYEGLGAAIHFILGDFTLWAWIEAAATGIFAWEAWRRWRRRKDRKPSRVLGVVRNLGHRLAVVPVPGGAR